MRHNRHGITLIELLVVMVVIGILATIAIPRFMSSREEAFKTRALADLRNLSSHQEIYWDEDRGYASDIAQLDIDISRGVSLEITDASGTGWAAQASQSFLPSMTCGIYYGSADPANGAPAESAGVVTCSR